MDSEKNSQKILIKTPQQVDLDNWEKGMYKIRDTTVVVFPSFKLAFRVASCFIKDLIPRVGSKEEAAKFPLIKSGPLRNADDVMSEALGLQKSPVDEEVWFLIGNSRFQEFYDYLVNRYPEMNPEVEIEDLR